MKKFYMEVLRYGEGEPFTVQILEHVIIFRKKIRCDLTRFVVFMTLSGFGMYHCGKQWLFFEDFIGHHV